MADGGFSSDGGEQLAPDGGVSYTFNGHVIAKAVDLPASPTTNSPSTNPQADSRINWTAAGAAVAYMAGIYSNAVATIRAAADVLQLFATQSVQLKGGRATVTVVDPPASGVNQPVRVSASADAAGATVIRADGTSTFVQLGTDRRVRHNYGQTTITFDTPNSGVAAVYHDLPAAPHIVHASVVPGGALFYGIDVRCQYRDTNQIDLYASLGYGNPANVQGGSVLVCWTAVLLD